MGTVGLVLALAVPARAAVEVGAGVPFSAHDLERALATRGAAPPDVTILAVTPTSVEVVTPAGVERVDLGGARGPAAARLLALHLIDVPDAIDAPDAIALRVAPAPPPGDALRLGVAAGAGRGVEAVDPTITRVAIDATATRGRWRAGAGLAWEHGLARAADPTQPVAADLGLARVVVGAALGPVEGVVGPTAGRYDIGGASGWLWGLSAGARVRLASARAWRISAGVDADVLDPRVVVRLDGRAFAATPRAAVVGSVAFEWVLTR